MKARIAILTLLAGAALCASQAQAQFCPQPQSAPTDTRVGGDKNGGCIILPPVIDVGKNVKIGGGVDYHLAPQTPGVDGGHVNLEVHF